MNVLFYHAGADCLAEGFKLHGHNVVDIMLNDEFDVPFYSLDTGWDFTALKEAYGKIDVVLANPNCKSYGPAGHWYHRTKNHEAKTDLAMNNDVWNMHFVQLLKFLNPRFYFIENPRGALRYHCAMSTLPHYDITYASYGGNAYKPSTIFTNHPCPNFKPVMGMKECKKLRDAGKLISLGPYPAGGLKRAMAISTMPKELTDHIYNLANMTDVEIMEKMQEVTK